MGEERVDEERVGEGPSAEEPEAQGRAPAESGPERSERAGRAKQAEGAERAEEVARNEDTGRTGRTGRPGEPVPVFSVPESLRSVDVAVGGRAVRGLLMVAVVLLLVLGGRWWWVQQQATGVPVEQVLAEDGTADPPEPVAGGTGQSARPSGTAGTSPADPAGAGDPAGPEGTGDEAAPGSPGGSEQTGPDPAGAAPGEMLVMVHVVGQVREPGVVELPAGSRVVDAVQAAGGLTDAADPTSLNLARAVVDGEQVWVGAPGEEPPEHLASAGPGGPGQAGQGQAGQGPGGGAAPGAGGPGTDALVVDLNQATQPQLEELPGVGPVTAGRILAWREEHGSFTVVEELMEVSGIGERTFEQLRPHVVVGG